MPDFSLLPAQRLLTQHQLSNQLSAGFVGMGLGKTAASLWSLSGLIYLGEARCVLIVAPRRVAVLTWPNEVERWSFASGVNTYSLRAKTGWQALAQRKPGLYLINYESLHKLSEWCLQAKAWPFSHVVFDESTKAKNHDGVRMNNFLPLLAKHKGPRWILTGTPSPETLFDLWGQIRLLDHGKALGASFPAFKHRYFKPTDYLERVWVPKKGTRQKLEALIAPYTCTLRREDYLDAPPQSVEDYEVALPPKAMAHYREMEKDMLLQLRDRTIEGVNAAVVVNKLLQITGGAIYDEERTAHHLHRAKLDALDQIAAKHPGEPLLVACNYVHEQDRIAASFEGAVLWRDAKSDKAQRLLAEQWNEGRIPMIVADPRSIGHGLNLQHGGRIVVWFSPTWSRECYDQMNARVCRTGQAHPSKVIRLVVPDTVDEGVLEALREKGDNQTALMKALSNIQKLRS